eukprot:12915563-Prorocentrum_lima.AAC.1
MGLTVRQGSRIEILANISPGQSPSHVFKGHCNQLCPSQPRLPRVCCAQEAKRVVSKKEEEPRLRPLPVPSCDC